MSYHHSPVRPVGSPLQSAVGQNRTARSRDVGFRHLLRQSTAETHERTEAVFACFLDAPQEYLTGYLAAQRSALGAMQAKSDSAAPPRCFDILNDLLARLDHDLPHTHLPPMFADSLSPLDPLAVDYLVLGSRMGTEVIRRRCFPTAELNDIPTYFTQASHADIWHAHCADLDSLDPLSDRAARVLRDAEVGFRIFHRAASLYLKKD